MTSRFLLRLIWMALGSLVATYAHAQQAVVRSADAPELEIGQAWLLRYGERCVAVLPLHVIDEAAGKPLFLSEGGQSRSEATSFIDLGDDIAAASVAGASAISCSTSMGTVARSVDRLLRSGGIGSLRSINGDGTVAGLTVAVVDDDGAGLLRIRPTLDAERIRKGQSGSLLLIDGTPVGMLLSMDARDGVATVMRVDRLLGMAETQLRNEAGAGLKVRDPAGGENTPIDAGSWQIASWSVDPVSPAHSALQLMQAGKGDGWRARVTQWPVVLEFTHPGGVQSISAVRLHAVAGGDIAERPALVQVMVSIAGNKPQWHALTTAKPHYVDGVAVLNFAATRARRLRFEIYRVNDATALALRRLEIVPVQ